MGSTDEILEAILNRVEDLKLELKSVESRSLSIRQELAVLERGLRAMSAAPRVTAAGTLREGSISRQIVDTLSEAGSAMSASEINRVVSLRLGREIPRTSFSPQLSRLVAGGRVLRPAGNSYQIAGGVAAPELPG